MMHFRSWHEARAYASAHALVFQFGDVAQLDEVFIVANFAGRVRRITYDSWDGERAAWLASKLEVTVILDALRIKRIPHAELIRMIRDRDPQWERWLVEEALRGGAA
jgi:hypothetical protein